MSRHRKRILILNWRDLKNRNAGGAEVYIHEIAKRFVRDGFEVLWFSSKETGLSTHEVIDGIETIRKGSWITVYAWAFFYYIFKLRKRIDIIIDCQNGTPFFSPLYSRKKIICLIHHVHRHVFKHYSPNFVIKYLGISLESLIRFVYIRSDIIAVSPSTKEALRHTLSVSQPITVVYNGVNGSFLNPGEKDEWPLVLYLGRLKKYKKIDDLLESFAKLRHRIPKAQLIIAGNGEEEASLKALAVRLNIHEITAFTGFVSEEYKKTLLQKAWVLVYPSTYEGWGISVIEANACGTIAIGSDVAGLRDSIQDTKTGILYPLGNKISLEGSLFDILTNNKKRMDMEKQALLWSKRFDWEKSYQQFRSKI